MCTVLSSVQWFGGGRQIQPFFGILDLSSSNKKLLVFWQPECELLYPYTKYQLLLEKCIICQIFDVVCLIIGDHLVHITAPPPPFPVPLCLMFKKK